MVAKRSSLAAVLLAMPGSALALGLGNIHVQSHLDQPLDARITLVDPTPGALQSLSVGVASIAAYTQVDLNRPAYLDGTHTKIIRASDGRVIVHVTSDQPVTDPVVHLLIKASWDRGVLIHEYTLLLNPPVYMPRHTQAPQAIAAPVTGPGHRVGAIRHPASAARAPAAQAPAVPAAASTPHSVPVHRGDTLSGIASRISGAGLTAARTHQWMVAIYRANPQAFDRNMNLLRSGTVLSIPARSSARQISPAAAWGEIRHQTDAWRSTLEARGSSSGRLRLVAPPGTGAGAQTGHGSTPAAGEVQALKSRVRTLQGELAQEKRLLQVKSAALAQLQAQVGSKPAPAQTKPAGHPAQAAASAATAASKPAPKPTKAPVLHPRPLAQPSLVTVVFGVLKSYWWAVAGLVLLLAGFFALRVSRARREPAGDDLLGEAAAESVADFPGPAPDMARSDSGFDVGETTLEHSSFAAEEGTAPVVTRHVSTDETISSETALNLDQGDPLAEADFHMAYGLYDQAADLIRLAIAREPERRDLKLKLLEVFFVWGNKEQFVHTAHELAEARADAAPGEWEKVVIMGRQLAPDDALFADAGVSGAASGGVDLDLEGGQSRVDFDPVGTAAPLAAAGGTAGGLDLDFGAALGGSDVGEQTDTQGDIGTVTDVNAALADPDSTMTDTGVTREMFDHPEVTVETPMGAEPTVEQPALPMAEHAALRQKVEALSQGSDRTAELAIDDLGLDLGTFETAVQSGVEGDAPTLVAGLDEQSRKALGLADAPTLVAGLDEHSRNVLAMADATAAADSEPEREPEPTGTTSAWKIDENELESLLSGDSPNGHDAGATSRLSALEAPDVDFDVGREPAKSSGNGLDFDVGTVTVPHADVAQHGDIAVDPGMAELEPATPSEVGTKLDLARAYMDMGDPEGARSILQEVVHEGSDMQRQEAGRLLESLPG